MNHANLLQEIVKRIEDYRIDEIAAPTSEHVTRWVNQFPSESQNTILAELNHILSHTYFSKSDITKFLITLSGTTNLTGNDPKEYWSSVNFLNIQRGGNSQKQMLSDFSNVLQEQFGLTVDTCGNTGGPYFYLDDVIFSGNRVRHDLEPWIASSSCPAECQLNIVTMAYHRGGQWFAKNKISKAATAAGKKVTVTWWRCIEIEDRKSYTNASDVLRPTIFPDDPFAQRYIQQLSDAGYPPVTRKPQTPPFNSRFFSSEEGRQLFENEMLSAGLKIKQTCTMLPESIRPLGFSGLHTLGFGSIIVTYRNCPNTCPPAFWAGNPWYPLFPRKTN